MTGNLILDSLISLAAIGLMVGLAWVLLPPPPVSITEEIARERLAFDEPDFTPVRWLIDTDGRAAIAEGARGDVAIVSLLGIDLVTRRYPAAALRVAEEGGSLVIDPVDSGARAVKVQAADAALWARKFAHGMPS